MQLEICVDRARCIGSGECVRLAPGVFDQDDRALSVVADPRGESEATIVRAMTACPVDAISLRVGGTRVGPDELKHWMHGTQCTDPVVSLIEQLCEEHHDLLALVATTPSAQDADVADEICSLTSDHLRNESEAYSAITALVDPRLVDTFESEHSRIHRALRTVSALRSDHARRGRAISNLANAVDHQIRLEESVLFPLAFAALAKS